MVAIRGIGKNGNSKVAFTDLHGYLEYSVLRVTRVRSVAKGGSLLISTNVRMPHS